MKTIPLEVALTSLTRLPGVIIGPDVTCTQDTLANILSGAMRVIAPDLHENLDRGQHFRGALDALEPGLQDRLPRLTEEIEERIRSLKPSLDLPYLAKAGWSACISLTDDMLFEAALRNHFDATPTSLTATIIDAPSVMPPERTVPIYKLLGNVNNQDPAHKLAMSESQLLVRQQMWSQLLRTFPDYLREGALFVIGTAAAIPILRSILGTFLGMGKPNVSRLIFLKNDLALKDPTILALCRQFDTSVVDASVRDLCAAIAGRKPRRSTAIVEVTGTSAKLDHLLKKYEAIASVVPSSISGAERNNHHLPSLIDGLFRPAAIDWDPFLVNFDLRRTITDDVKTSIRTHLENPLEGQSKPSVIRGEAGIGKTILLKRVAVELAAEGILVLWCRRSSGPGWTRNFRNLSSELSDHAKTTQTQLKVVVLCDDPWALRMDATDLMACFDRFTGQIAFAFALRNSDYFSWEQSTLPLGIGEEGDHEVPFTLDDGEWEDLASMLQKIGAVSDQAAAERELSLVPQRHATDILCSLWYLIPETRSQLTDSLRDEYCRLGNAAEAVAGGAQAIAADSDTARRAYEFVTVTSNLEIGLPIEVLVRALSINYDDWVNMIVSGKPLWGLLYDEQDEGGNVAYHTRNEIVTRVLLDLVNGGVGHVGEYRVLCDLMRACDGGAAVYRSFVLEILIRNRSKLRRILTFDQGMELFNIAENSLVHEDRLLEHHKGIWIDDAGRDSKAAYIQLEKALHTEIYPSAERDAPLEHIHTSMASTIVRMVRAGERDRSTGFQLVRDHLRQASSPTFFNSHTAHVSANLLFELSQQNGRQTQDEISMASISDALHEIERAFQLIGTHNGRNYFRNEKSVRMLEELQSKIIRSIGDLKSMKDFATKMYESSMSQVGFEAVARRLLVEASESGKGTAYNEVSDFISTCASLIGARDDDLSIELIVVRVDLIIRWRIQRFLSVDWGLFADDLKIVLSATRYRDDAIKRFYFAVALFHLNQLTQANAMFATLRRLQLPVGMQDIRCYYLGGDGNPRRVQGTLERKHNYSYVFVPDLHLSVVVRSHGIGGGSGSVIHVYIGFALNGPTAVVDKPKEDEVRLA